MDIKFLKESFDVESYLVEMGVDYEEGGNNVSYGWVGVNCPFCSDHSNHMGIHIDSKRISCWLCNTSGDIITFIRQLEGISFKQAKNRLEEYYNPIAGSSERVVTRTKKLNMDILPDGFQSLTDNVPLVVKKYLIRRRLRESIIQDYSLGYCQYGDYNLSIIAPVYIKRQLVSFQSVDVTGKRKISYIDCPPEKARVINKHAVYGIDQVPGRQVIVVEGLTDKWNIGLEAVSLFGKNYTREQMMLMLNILGRDTLVKVMFDPDASKKAELFSNMLVENFTKVLFLKMNGDRDPAELTQDEVREIKNL